MTASPNRALWRAAHSLTHPAIVLAVIGLLINDHWLRHVSPSWLTGKLGDFTWLIFAPLIAALCFALVIPRRIRHHTRIVGWLSFVSVGLWFAAAKTIPAVHALTATVWSALVGWQGSLRLDPTDLLALPGLLIGAWVWSRADDSPLNLRPLAYVIAALGLVGTLASDGYQDFPDTGITCIGQAGDVLVTVGSFMTFRGHTSAEEVITTYQWNTFTSQDGGLTWDSEYFSVNELPEDFHDFRNCQSTSSIVDPQNPAIQYRWERGERIERSTDGGQTWALDYDLYVLRQEVRYHYNHSNTERFDYLYRSYLPSPYTGMFDATTGNLVLTMSWDGVLVRTPDGTWRWADVGRYGLADIQTLSKLGQILFLEWWLAGALFFLVITTSTAYIRQRLLRLRRRRALMLGWIGWGLLFLVFGSGQSISYDMLNDLGGNWELGLLIGFFSLALLVMAIPLSIGAVWDILHNFRRYAAHIFGSGLGVVLLYLFPLLLWTQGTIPRYLTALIFSLILTLAGLFAAYKYLTRVLPILPPSTENEAPPS